MRGDVLVSVLTADDGGREDRVRRCEARRDREGREEVELGYESIDERARDKPALIHRLGISTSSTVRPRGLGTHSPMSSPGLGERTSCASAGPCTPSEARLLSQTRLSRGRRG